MTKGERAELNAIAALPLDWSALDGATVLVGGGSGFLGSRLIEVLRARNESFGAHISVLSVSRHAHADGPGVTCVRHDVTQPLAVDRPVDLIVHLASNTHPAQYAADPVGTISTNILGAFNLLELARKKGAKRFLLASSVEIYGTGAEKPLTEHDCGKIDCNTVRAGYNESKRVSESLLRAYGAQYGVNGVTARFARVFGADEKNDTKAMAQFLARAAAGEEIELKSAGTQRFSWCYVADAVGGLLTVLLRGENGEAYNIADDDEGKTLGEYAELLAALAGTRVVRSYTPQAGASVADYAVLNCAKLKALGWAPTVSVTEGLRRTLGHLRERMQ